MVWNVTPCCSEETPVHMDCITATITSSFTIAVCIFFKSLDDNVRNRLLLEKLLNPRVLKKFQAFYGNRIFRYSFAKTFSLRHILSQTNPVQVLPLCSFKIHFNIILFASRCLSGLSPSVYPSQTCMYFSSPPRVPRAPVISFSLI